MLLSTVDSNCRVGSNCINILNSAFYAVWGFTGMYHHVGMSEVSQSRHHRYPERWGFAALLRYHWMEEYSLRNALRIIIPLAILIGFGITDFFIVHIFTLVGGQLGHGELLKFPLAEASLYFKNIVRTDSHPFEHHAPLNCTFHMDF